MSDQRDTTRKIIGNPFTDKYYALEKHVFSIGVEVKLK